MWVRNNLPRSLSNLESTFGVPTDHLTPLKRHSGIELQASERILNILNNLNSEIHINENDLLLLRSCGRVLVDQSFSARSELCDKVWKKLEECKINFGNNHYNIYLQNCIDNRKQIKFRTFLDNMRCNPNSNTFKLLLECACENGDMGQATEILEEMKRRGFTFESTHFNTLLMGYAAKGGLIEAKKFYYEISKRVFIQTTSETHFQLLRGLVLYNSKEEFISFLNEFSIRLQDHNYFDLLLTLGFKRNYSWLKRILDAFGPLNMSNQDIQQLSLLCKQLIYLNRPEPAIFYYTLFVKPPELGNAEYAFTLLEDMLFSKTSVEKIITLINNLKAKNLNNLALEKLTNVALMNQNTEVAWELLEKFTEPTPRYFWPILEESGKNLGKIGIFSSLKKMVELGVRPDCETLEYCIPFCGSNNYQNLFSRMQSLGFTNRELFPPFLRFFLKKDDVSACLEMCKNNEIVGVSVEQFLQPLVITWRITKDNANIAELLRYISKMSNKQLDYSGIFLYRTVVACRKFFYYHNFFLDLLMVMKSRRMFISSISAESLLKLLDKKSKQNEDIKKAIDQITHAPMDTVHNPIPHSSNKHLQELESNLIELRKNNLGTRKVLHELMVYHCKLGNEEKVQELRQQFQDSGYKESPGLQISLMYLYMQKNDVERVLNTYNDFQHFGPTFKLTEFKITELAAFLVRNNNYDMALKILMDETEKRQVNGGEPLVQNCRRLIESANNGLEIITLFHYLNQNGYCQVSNFLLEPFVEFYINRKCLRTAVLMFKYCVNAYGYTPQDLELLCELVKVENTELIEEVYNCIFELNGPKIAFELYIAALAENGFTKPLRELLLEYKCNLNHLIKARCERWIKENKILPLEILADAAFQLPLTVIDSKIIYSSIIKLHSKNNDCESAEKFYRYLVENNESASLSLFGDFVQLINRCRYKMPNVN